jgi:hypothetical protein
MLLTSQKNEIYNIIEKGDLSPNLFKFSEVKGNTGSITYVRYSDDFVFMIHYIQNGWSINYSPALARFSQSLSVSNWYEVLKYLKEWLNYLKREISQIDKWKRLEEQIELINISYSDNNDKFSAQEFEELRNRMFLLKGHLIEINLPTDQLDILNSKIDHLTDLAISMNKFDWYSMFIGSIMSIIIQLGVTHENAKALWTLIKNLFNSSLLP